MRKNHQSVENRTQVEVKPAERQPTREVYSTSDLPPWLRDAIAASRVPVECAKFNGEVNGGDGSSSE